MEFLNETFNEKTLLKLLSVESNNSNTPKVVQKPRVEKPKTHNQEKDRKLAKLRFEYDKARILLGIFLLYSDDKKITKKEQLNELWINDLCSNLEKKCSFDDTPKFVSFGNGIQHLLAVYSKKQFSRRKKEGKEYFYGFLPGDSENSNYLWHICCDDVKPEDTKVWYSHKECVDKVEKILQEMDTIGT